MKDNKGSTSNDKKDEFKTYTMILKNPKRLKIQKK